MKEWTRKRKADTVMGIILQVYFLVPWIHHHTMYGYLYQALKMNDYVRTYNEMLLPSLKKIWGYTKPTAFVFLCILFLMLFFQIVEFMRLYHIFINERPSDYRGFFWILFMIAFAVFNDGFRPIVPQYYEGSISRKELAAMSFAISFGLVIGFGIPTSIAATIILIHCVLLTTDIIGTWCPDSKIGTIAAGVIGGFIWSVTSTWS